MKNLKIYDDFLEEDKFKYIHNHMMGNKFPWNLGIITNEKRDIALCDELDNVQFCNWIYKGNEPGGPEIKIVEPIINHPILAMTSLVRVKANMTMRTNKLIEHGWHRDGYFSCNAAIYYVNSNDGYTKFEDGTKVESVENRLITFNTQDTHTGTSCTNSKIRCVLNFNYYSATKDELDKLEKSEASSEYAKSKIYGF